MNILYFNKTLKIFNFANIVNEFEAEIGIKTLENFD